MKAATTILGPSQLRYIKAISHSEISEGFDRGVITGLAVIACSELSGFDLDLVDMTEKPLFIWQNLGGCVADSGGLDLVLLQNDITNLIVYGHYPCEVMEMSLRCAENDSDRIRRAVLKRTIQTRSSIVDRFGQKFDRQILMTATQDFVLRQAAELLNCKAAQRRLIDDLLRIHVWIANGETDELLVFEPEEQVFRSR